MRTLLAATFVRASDCNSHSLLEKRNAKRSLYWIKNGAPNIEISIAANTAWLKAGSMRSRPSICASNTNPNSPAWARHRPVRIEIPVLEPKARESNAISPNLNINGPINNSKTSTHCCKITTKSSSIPTVIMNRPSKTSRKCFTSSSTWCR